jgi:hypothetical protein
MDIHQDEEYSAKGFYFVGEKKFEYEGNLKIISYNGEFTGEMEKKGSKDKRNIYGKLETKTEINQMKLKIGNFTHRGIYKSPKNGNGFSGTYIGNWYELYGKDEFETADNIIKFGNGKTKFPKSKTEIILEKIVNKKQQ